jgi:hypothetical protein
MIDPNKIYQSFLEAGEAWSDAHGAAELLEHTLKSVKAQITLECKHSEKCSMAEATEMALTSSDYRDACRIAVEARTTANKAKVKYSSVQAWFEAKRSAEASNRASMGSQT